MVMPTMARDFTVIAVDQPGRGLSDKPHDGYDAGTLANDIVGLVDALGQLGWDRPLVERGRWTAAGDPRGPHRPGARCRAKR